MHDFLEQNYKHRWSDYKQKENNIPTWKIPVTHIFIKLRKFNYTDGLTM